MQFQKLKHFIILLSYFVFSIFLLFSLSGCYDATSVEDYYYVVALGIDEIENSDNINLAIQIAQSSSESGSSSQATKHILYQIECLSVDSGVNILNNYLSKKLNLSHCSTVVFSEKLAKSGIISFVNTLQNNIELRPDCNVIISSTSAYDVLKKVSNSGENFSARYFEHIISSEKYTGFSLICGFRQFFTDMNSPNESALAIYTTVDKDTIQNTGIAIFKEDNMIGHVYTEGVISHLLLTNKLTTSTVTIPSPFKEDDKIDLTIRRKKPTQVSVNLVNNSPYIESDIYITADIVTANANSDYSSTENLKKLEYNLNKYIEKIIYEYLDITSKEYSCDTVSFGERLSTKYSTLDEFKKVHWSSIYKDSFFNVRAHCEVVSSNLITKQ